MNKKKIIIYLFFIFLLVIVTSFLLFTDKGEESINYFFPTVERTIEINQKKYSSINSYETTTKIDSENIVSSRGFVNLPNNYQILASVPFGISSSTIDYQISLETAVKIIGIKMYVKDNYDNTYHPINSGVIAEQIIKPLIPINPSILIQSILQYKDGIKISKVKLNKDSFFRFEGEITVMPFDNFDELKGDGPIKFSLNISRKTYLPKSIFLNWQSKNKGEVKVYTDFFSYGESPVQIAQPKFINELGDFWVRESVYTRTSASGTFDKLWQLWEQKYFNCKYCVNRYGDEDNDKINNIKEFIFGSNPLLKDSNNNGMDDYDEIINNKHPVYANKISSIYENAISYIIKEESTLQPLQEKSISQNTDKYTKRSPMTVSPKVTIPQKAEFWVIPYKFVGEKEMGEQKDYLTVYFDKKLIYKTFANPSDQFRYMIIPVSNLIGESGSLIFVLNSVGTANQQLLIDIKKIAWMFNK